MPLEDDRGVPSWIGFRRMSLHRMSLAALTLVSLTLGACSSSGSAQLNTTAVPTSVTVSTASFPGVGTVLASGGRALYVFSPDHHAVMTCTGSCTGTWPPLLTSGSYVGTAGITNLSAIQAGGSTSDSASDKARVVTFHGWPLYFYAGDTDSTAAHGQSLFLNGGPWYVIRADGTIVTTALVDGAPASGAAS